jgi:hypothetical protein
VIQQGHWILLPNFGAEEQPPPNLTDPLYERLALLWSLLFAPKVEWIDPPKPHSETLCDALAHSSDPLSLTTDHPILTPWLHTPAAHQRALHLNLPIFGPQPTIVESCHDKAFVVRHLSSDDPFSGIAQIFHPDQFVDTDHFIEQVQRDLSQWPSWATQDWTIKPRFGSSGRGRLPGTGTRVDPLVIKNNLPRLIRQGGVILEPFVRDRQDISVQLNIPSDPNLPIAVLGSLSPIVTTSGSFLGHRGIIHNHQAHSSHLFDNLLRQRSLHLAQIARDAGYWGPCGIDAFSFFHQQQPHLHLCEFNARWTVGHLLHGIIRRLSHLPISDHARLETGFEFRLDATDPCNLPSSIPLTQSNDRVTSAITHVAIAPADPSANEVAR